MFYLADKTIDFSPGCRLWDTFKELLQRNRCEARTYKSFCNKKQAVRMSKDYC